MQKYILISPNYDAIKEIKGRHIHHAIQEFKASVWTQGGINEQALVDKFYGDWFVYKKSKPPEPLIFKGILRDIKIMTLEEHEFYNQEPSQADSNKLELLEVKENGSAKTFVYKDTEKENK